VPQLHQINPNMLILLYRNIRAIYNYSDEWQTALDQEWLLRDSSGALVHSTIWPEIYMTDIGNPEYQDFVANWIKNYTDLYGYDGVFSDNGLLVTPSECFWGSSGEPVNSRTGNLWTSEEIVDAYIAFHNRIKATIGSKLDIANGIFHGERFFSSDKHDNYVKVLTESNLDGFMSEGLFNWNEYYSEDKWKKSVDFVVWIQENFLNQTGKIFSPHAQCAVDQIPADCTTQQMATFVFSSLLLGINKSQNYLSLQGAMLLDEIQDLFKIDLGVPKANYYLIEGTHVYARDFTKIKVLVNPTDQPFLVYLDGDYETLEGQIVSSVNMEPHTGLILKVIY